MNQLLTKEQALELFRQEAVFIGTEDAAPLYRLIELFGKKAAVYAKSVPYGSNGFGVGNWTLSYATLKGFLAAASFHNVELIRDNLRKEWVA